MIYWKLGWGGVISITLFLESTGIATETIIKSDDTLGEECEDTIGSNACDEDNDDVTDDYVLPPIIFSDDTLTLQNVGREDRICNISVFTKID